MFEGGRDSKYTCAIYSISNKKNTSLMNSTLQNIFNQCFLKSSDREKGLTCSRSKNNLEPLDTKTIPILENPGAQIKTDIQQHWLAKLAKVAMARNYHKVSKSCYVKIYK